ncbi:MAG: hypothetical protein DRQ55_11240 [Planctomycetota bacterium]|nr:MAG: hypothetical protein DRQ55_11240 [Planctomycetota bacterium]RKZ10176.1 MAG: hypothetical protein DRQ32_07455 [bacterium]
MVGVSEEEAEAARITKLNRSLRDAQLLDALSLGAENVRDLRRRASLVVGQQLAGLAASGASVDSGSALEAQAESAYIGELDARRAMNNTARTAWGLRISGKVKHLEALLAIKAASSGGGGGSVSSLYGGFNPGHPSSGNLVD